MFLRKYRTESLIALAVAIIAACWLPIRMRFPFDDTYITFRYAANVAHGFGIVWNPGGAHTEGYTNFLFMLLLAPFSAMGWDLVAVSQAIGVVAVVVSAIALYRVSGMRYGVSEHNASNDTEHLLPKIRFLAVALFLFDPFTWFNAYSGMETSLFTMWLLLAIWAVGRGRPTYAFACATLATLTRPEGALMGMILIAIAFGSSLSARRSLKAAATWFVLPLLLYAGWKLWYFGNLLPNSFYIKVAQGETSTVLPGRGALFHFYVSVWYMLALAFFAVWKGKKNLIVRVAAWWCLLLSAFYLFSQLLMDFYDRFTNSIETILIVLLTLGIANWAMDHSEILSARNSRRRRTFVLFLSSFIVFHLGWSYFVRGALGYVTSGEPEDPYRHIALVFRSIPDHPHITLAWADAGMLPYYSGLRNIDVVGLNLNEIAHAHTADEVIPIVMATHPDMIIIPLEAMTATSPMPLDSSRRIFRQGHGLIGSKYPELANRAMTSGYVPIALLRCYNYDLDLLADTLSPHYRDIVNTIAPRIGRDPDFLPPSESIR